MVALALMLDLEMPDRRGVAIARPNAIQYIWGPQYIQGAYFGIQYILNEGFPAGAVVGGPWEIEVR